MINFIFGVQINIKDFYKLILSFLVRVTTHPQSTQNNMQNNRLKYLQESMGDEVDFSLQINTTLFYNYEFGCV